MRCTGSRLGNVQLIDWRTGVLSIAVQRGFTADALAAFAHLRFQPGPTTACMRAVRSRRPVAIEDVEADEAFAAYRKLAAAAGFRSVASVPMITGSNALVGVVSIHDALPLAVPERSLQEITKNATVAAQQVIQLSARLRPNPFSLM